MKQRRDRLGLAMTEAVPFIRRLRGHPNTHQRRRTGREIKQSIRQRADHGAGPRGEGGPALQAQQEQGNRGARQRRAAPQGGIIHHG